MGVIKTLVINNIIILIIIFIFVICFVNYYVKKNTNDNKYIDINDSIDLDNIIKHLIISNPTISKYYKDKNVLSSDDKNAILTSYILESNPLLSDYVLLSNQHFIEYTLQTDKNISDYIIQNKANMDIAWMFKVGDKVKIKIFNDPKSMHPMQHPFHIHGQKFLVLSTNGVKNTNMVWKDTTLIQKGDTVEILVDMENPGMWMAHCHIAEHLESGWSEALRTVFEDGRLLIDDTFAQIRERAA